MKKPSSSSVFNRLDQAYSYWETDMWGIQLAQHLSQMKGEDPDIIDTGYPVNGYEKTRSMLLEAATADNLSYLLPDFRSRIPEKPKLDHEQTTAEIASGKPSLEFRAAARWYEFHMPYHLGQWSATSRRIYHLPQDLVLMLQATSLKGKTYRDIHFPLSSFGLALEHPIITDTGQEIDFILLCGESAPEAWYAFSKKLESWKPIDSLLRQKIDKARTNKNDQRLRQLAYKPLKYASRFSETCAGFAWPTVSDVDNWDVDIEDDLKMASKIGKDPDYLDWTDKLFRVVIGFAFYLQAFHESKKDLVTRTSEENRPELRASSYGTSLVSPEEILQVQSIFSLSKEERVGLSNFLAGKGGWEINTHFREGYWRRPSGEGDNPLAQKTIWFRPTMVRRDRLAENTLPMGTGVNV